MATASTSSTGFPFLVLPPELRVMVYRQALVTHHRIYLDSAEYSFIELPCRHIRRISRALALLRVSRQVSFEALTVFYGENHFVSTTNNMFRPAIQDIFSRANLFRVRILTLQHHCGWRRVPSNPDIAMVYNDAPAWNATVETNLENAPEEDAFIWDELWTDLSEGPGDSSDADPDGYKTVMAPRRPMLEPEIWQLVLYGLRRLTIVISIRCHRHLILWPARPRVRDKLLTSLYIRRAMRLYDRLPPSVQVRRRVWCERHYCDGWCNSDTCDRQLRYLRRAWRFRPQQLGALG